MRIRLLLPLACLLLPASAAFADLMADSPVAFPKEGALPPKFPTDVKVKGHREPEPGYALFDSVERSPAQVEAIRAAMPAGRFAPPATDWAHLARTRRVLAEGGALTILAVGDSIVADTMRSAWVANLAAAYPKADVRSRIYVRGGGGCQHYKQEGRVAKVIVPERPDLVLIGGISQQDVASIREVIHQVRAALPEAEFLLFTGAFGTDDPRVPEELARGHSSGTAPYGRALKALADEERCAYLDMTTPWAEYVRSAGGHPHRFYRDVVHANEYGEQILSKIMMAYWTDDAPK